MLFDWLAADFSTVDEHASFGALEQNSIVGSAGDIQLQSICVGAHDIKVVRGVIRIINKRVAVLKFDGVLGVGAID